MPFADATGNKRPAAVEYLLAEGRKLVALPFVRGVAIFQVGSVVMMATGLASSVVYARLLGLQQFGLYAVVTAFAALLGVATAYGQETALATFLAEAAGRKDRTAMEAVLRYFLQATLVATAVNALLIVLAPALSLWLRGGPETGQYVRILLFNDMLQPANVLLFVILQIGHKVGRVAVIENLADIVQLAVSTVLLLLGWGVLGILVGTLAVSAVTVPLYVYLYERAARELHFPSLGRVARTLWRRGTGAFAVQGLWIALDQNIGKNLYPNLFFVVLNATAPLPVVGLFRLAFRLASVPLNLVMPSITRMATVAVPRIAALHPSDLLAACRKLVFGTVGLAVASAAAAALVFPPLIPLLYGKAFSAAIPALLILLTTNVLSATHVLSVPLLRVFHRVWVLSAVNVLGVAVALVAYFCLVPWAPAAIAMSLAILVFHAHTLLVFAPLRDFLKGQGFRYHRRR
jgi:O-antigen/teichoic acid export membrane protein